jgi:dihydroorotate dehydrogenase electron transfer subunit
MGGAKAGDILCAKDFRRLGWKVVVATEDGSMGTRGLVTRPLDKWLSMELVEEAEFFVCGPDGLLRAVGERAKLFGWKAWLSLDKHMGCGVGACLACVQKIKTADGEEVLARVCREGPVFEAREVVWES